MLRRNPNCAVASSSVVLFFCLLVARISGKATETSVLDRATADFPAETSVLDRATADFPAETSVLDRATADFPAETSVLDRATADFPNHKKGVFFL